MLEDRERCQMRQNEDSERMRWDLVIKKQYYIIDGPDYKPFALTDVSLFSQVVPVTSLELLI